MATKEKLIAVAVIDPGCEGASASGLKEINELLEQGWRVAEVYQMTALAAGNRNAGNWTMVFTNLVRLYKAEG